jgi:hypothetical protein
MVLGGGGSLAWVHFVWDSPTRHAASVINSFYEAAAQPNSGAQICSRFIALGPNYLFPDQKTCADALNSALADLTPEERAKIAETKVPRSAFIEIASYLAVLDLSKVPADGFFIRQAHDSSTDRGFVVFRYTGEDNRWKIVGIGNETTHIGQECSEAVEIIYGDAG